MVLAQPLLFFVSFSWSACPIKSDSVDIGRASTGLCSHHSSVLCSVGNLMSHLETEAKGHSLGLSAHMGSGSLAIYTTEILEEYRRRAVPCAASPSRSPFISNVPSWLWPLRCKIFSLIGRRETEVAGEFSRWKRKEPATALKTQCGNILVWRCSVCDF